MLPTATLYHVGLRENEKSILTNGVLASRSRGKRTGSYWVTEELLVWAIVHVSARHSVNVNEILIFVGLVDFEEVSVQRTARPGVFFIPDDVGVEYSIDVPLDVF